MKLAIAFIILAILGVILAITVPKVQAASGSNDDNN